MTSRTIFACLAFVVLGSTTLAQKTTRMLMHTFQDGSTLIHVAVVDMSPTARGVITSPNAPARQRVFTVSHQQFEQMWRTLQSSGAEKYAGGEGASRTFDAQNYYVFSVGYMPNGKKTNYVVPKPRASSSLISLARQLEAYAH